MTFCSKIKSELAVADEEGNDRLGVDSYIIFDSTPVEIILNVHREQIEYCTDINNFE